MIKKFIIGLMAFFAVLFASPVTANAYYYDGQLYNGAYHAVVIHTTNGYYYWVYNGQYGYNMDRWRPDYGWQMAWHYSGDYTEHYTTCNTTNYTYCYSYGTADVVIDNGWYIL